MFEDTSNGNTQHEPHALRPKAPPIPTGDRVPSELLNLKRWCGWRYSWSEAQKKWTKLPTSPRTGQTIGVTPQGKNGEDWESHWVDFETARQGALRLKLDGVGFVFAEGDGHIGIDFDRCYYKGTLHPAVAGWLLQLKTYTEFSPSGTGIHAIGRGKLPATGNKRSLPEDDAVLVEMYGRTRFFTFSGRPLGDPLPIRDCQDSLARFHAHVFGGSRPEPAAPPIMIREFLTDDEIVRRITKPKSRWAEIFAKGKDGRTFVAEHCQGDDSKADFALCSVIARFTMSPAQIERLWRRSILWRPKAQEREDYRLGTINKALAAAVSELPPRLNTGEKAEVTWLWADRLPRGKLALIDGDPGLGKSMLALAIAVSVMFRRPFIDGSVPEVIGGVVLLSAEDDPRDTIAPRLVAAGAPDCQRIPLIHIPSTKRDGGQFSLADPEDRFTLEKAAAAIDAQLIVIDPLNAYLGDKVDSHNDQKIRQVLAPLSEIANRTGAVVLCLRHLAKSGGSKAIYRGMGSMGYTAAARANFFVAEHPEKPGTFVMAASKFNLGPKPVSLSYRLETVEVPGIARLVPRITGGEPCDLTADDLNAVQNSKAQEGGKLGEAVDFLRVMLSEGPMPRAEIEKKADKQKISPMTLRRAQQQLKIRPYQEDKKWWWRLPEEVVRLAF